MEIYAVAFACSLLTRIFDCLVNMTVPKEASLELHSYVLGLLPLVTMSKICHFSDRVPGS